MSSWRYFYMSDFARRIKEYRVERNLDQPDIAKMLGVTKQTVSGWESGKYSPPLPKVVEMATKLNVDLNWLIGSTDTPWQSPIRIKVLGRVPAGVPIEAIEEVIDWEDLDPRGYTPSSQFIGLRVMGDSMYPEYLDGDTIIVEQSTTAETGQDVVAYVNGYDATLKKFIRYENGSIELRPINPNYPTKIFTAAEAEEIPVQILGFVRELRRKK